MSYEQDRQKKIDAAVKNKERRLSKQELSIQICWAINNAVNTLTPTDKKDWQKNVKERYQWFLDEYRAWMIDNLPQDVIEVTDTPLPSSAKGITTNWDEKKQELYNEASKQDEHRVEYEQTK